MWNVAWKVETGWNWTGGTTSSKDTRTEIWGDEAGAAVKKDAAVVRLIMHNLNWNYYHLV